MYNCSLYKKLPGVNEPTSVSAPHKFTEEVPSMVITRTTSLLSNSK